MNPRLPASVPLGEFALGLSLRLGTRDWSALLVPARAQCEDVARELADEVRSLAESEAAVVELTERLLGDLYATKEPVVVAYEGDAPVDAIWPTLDLDRSQLPRARSVVLVLSVGAFEQLKFMAPNLASWIGASVSTADRHADVLSDAEREARLAALRAQFAMTDAEILDQARAGTAPSEPGVAEWLVLLGQGALLERHD